MSVDNKVIVESETTPDPVVLEIETPGFPGSGRARAPSGSVAR